LFVSFAQNFEDVILHRVFGDKQDGFYIDIGAYHPTIGSVTRHFYDKGWHGINVEPGPVFADLVAARPRDTNLNLAVLDYTGEAYFTADAKDPGSSMAGSELKPDSRPIACETLTNIVAKHTQGRSIDFLKIDVEGSEGAIVRSTDWRAIRPTILVIESVRPWTNDLVNQSWEPVLVGAGYKRMYFDGINCFYAPEEVHTELQRHFAAPINILDDSIPHYLLEQIQRLSSDAATLPLDPTSSSPQPHAAPKRARPKRRRTPSVREAKRPPQKSRRTTLSGVVLRAVRPIFLPVARKWRTFLTAPTLDGFQASSGATARLATSLQGLEQRFRVFSRRQAARSKADSRDHVATQERVTRAEQQLREAISQLETPLRESLHRIEALLRQVLTASDAAVRDAGLRNEAAVRESSARTEALLRDSMARAESADHAMGKVVSDAMLTVAIDAARLTGRQSGTTDESPTSATMLALPRGREARIVFATADESVGRPIASSGGLWEPHVQRFFERHVTPDCGFLDVGANIGVHSLNVASLAPKGRVTAFEANPGSFELLSRNLAPRAGFAEMEAVPLALWDKPERLQISGAKELAGSSFLAPGLTDAALTEAKLRSANPSALRSRQLHFAAIEVEALPLDSWIEVNPRGRIDLIKMDVEGAESRVLDGARRTITTHRPTLIVEYNPSCAVNYFDEAPDRLFQVLTELFTSISLIDPGGDLLPLTSWEQLASHIANGKGWEDLACRA
jgi:FkbM family methyltransferase